MKKIIRTTSLFLLFAILLSSLISCGGDKSAFEKMDDREKVKYAVEKTDKYYEKSLQQHAEISCEVTGEVNGVAIKMEIDGTSTRTVTNGDTDKMRYVNVSEVKSVTRTGTEKETENYKDVTAFIDGYMYMGHDTDKKNTPDTFLKSPISADDFTDFFKKSQIVTEEPDYWQICDNVTVTLSEDGKIYTVRITHGADNVNEELTKVTNELTSSFGIKFDLVSLELEYTVDAKKLIISEGKIKFETETPKFGDDQLKFTYESVITSDIPEESEPTIENIDNYVETGDLRYAQFLINRLNGLISADSIGYTLISSAEAESGGQVVSELEETDKINCGYKNGIYVYSIDANANMAGQEYDIDLIYNGSQQKVSITGGGSQTTETNEILARMYLINLLNPVLITTGDITSVTVKETKDDVTTVEFKLVFGDKFAERFESMGLSADITNGSARMIVEFDKDMNVISVKFKVSGDCVTMGQSFSIKGETILKDFTDGDVSAINPVKYGSSDL